jgi:two-component system, NtrC family, sensor histidine kinase AtoS
VKNRRHSWSLRSRILIVLLLLTGLLSSLSFFFIYSLDEISEVSESMTSDNVPELLWLGHWETELAMKEQYTEMGIETDFCCDFISNYENIGHEENSLEATYGAPPASLDFIQHDLDMLDFMIENNVGGLLALGNTEGAASYIETEYMALLEEIQGSLAENYTIANAGLDSQQDRFGVIIEEALDLLLLITSIGVILSILVSYRISAVFTRPVQKMEQQLNHIAAGSYGAVLEETNQVELQPLARSINEMSYQLKRSFDMLTADKQYREQILDSLPVGIVTSDEQAEDIQLNKAARKVMGEDFDVSMLPRLKKEAEGIHRFWEIFASKGIFQNEKVWYTDGEEACTFLVSQSELVNENQETIGKIFYFINITETEKLEQQVRRQEKLAVIGELAAGAAHEIRNPLAVIDGFLNLMKQSLTEEEVDKFHLHLLLKEIERINGIIEEMLMLSKPEAPKFQKVYLQDVIEEILPLMKETLDTKNIAFHMDLEQKKMFLDTSQMKQVFHNLFRNSAEAVGEHGRITILGKEENGTYQVQVIDDGSGIPGAAAEQIFDPFSTTKESGTGLGLTIAERIMDNHRGRIFLKETSPEGTVICLEFPLKN